MNDNNMSSNGNNRGIISLADVCKSFNATFFDNEECRKWILKKIHPAGPICPNCTKELPEKYHNRFWQNARIHCPSCGKWFTALTGTMLHGMHMTFAELMILAVFLALNQPLKLIAKYLDVDPETIRIWRRKMVNICD